MITFLNTLFLWSLPLLAAPVIIHLLNRTRRQIVPWGAMQFLVEAAPRRRRILKIRELLLLLLRILAIVLFILALAQPLLRIGAFGITGPRDIILVLDTSLSTGRVQDGGTLLDREVEAAIQAIDQMSEQDIVRVLLAGVTPEWLVPGGIWIKPESRREIRSRLKQIKPSLAAANMPRCIQEALDAAPANEKATRLIVVLTDGQAYGWRASESGLWTEIKPKADAIPSGVVMNVLRVDDPDRNVNNLCIHSVAAARPFAVVREPIALSAWIRNSGQTPSEAKTLAWEAQGSSIGLSSIPPLAPGEKIEVRIETVFNEPGVREIVCTIQASDDLPLDDAWRYTAEVQDRLPVLVVDDETQDGLLSSGSGYLLASLGHMSDGAKDLWRSAFIPTVVDSKGLATVNLNNYRCVILADANIPAPAVATHLKEFVSRGGGLWIVCGNRTDTAAFNAVYNTQTSLSPLPLGDALGNAGDHNNAAQIRPPPAEHPATRLLGDVERMDLDRVQIYRRYHFKGAQNARDLSVLLAEADGSPIAIENAAGRGRIIIQSLPLNVDWSNLPICQSFVVMVHEWLWYLVEPSLMRWNLNPGEIFSLPLPADRFNPKARLALPSGEILDVAADLRENIAYYNASTTLWPGSYRMILEDMNRNRLEFPFQVARDAAESELTPLAAAEEKNLSAAGVQFVSDPFRETRPLAKVSHPEPLWTPLLIFLLLLMLGELLLAGSLTRQRTVPAPSMSPEEDWLPPPKEAVNNLLSP